SWVGAAGYCSASVDVTRLSRRQVAELQRVWRDLRSEQGAAEPPDTDDSVFRAGLDAWLTGVISSDGRLADTSLDDLLDLEREAKDHAVARAYVDRVVAVVVPRREAEPPWHAELADVIREHCRERGYGLSDGGRDRFGYRTLSITVPNREGPVELSLNGETFLLTFPGGFTWPEFEYAPEAAKAALQDQLRLVDSYADPDTRTVSVKRALRSPRTELHLSDGTVLRRHGGRRPQS
ncbi:MAG: hypothetical protein ACJ72A_12480, partial [Nocardioidaceae bacterium]